MLFKYREKGCFLLELLQGTTVKQIADRSGSESGLLFQLLAGCFDVGKEISRGQA